MLVLLSRQLAVQMSHPDCADAMFDELTFTSGVI